MSSKAIPEKGVMCHRTAFQLSCRECVVEHGCKLWVRVTGRDKDTDAVIDTYGCADEFKALMEAQGVAQLSMKLDMIAKGIDHLRLEVQGQTIQPMLDNIVHINKRLAEAQGDASKLMLGIAEHRDVNGRKLIGSD